MCFANEIVFQYYHIHYQWNWLWKVDQNFCVDMRNIHCKFRTLTNISWSLTTFSIHSAIVDGFLITYQFGICCVYIVFVATNVKSLCDEYIYTLDVKIHMVILLLPLILLNCIKNLKVLAPFSTFANIITFIGKIH